MWDGRTGNQGVLLGEWTEKDLAGPRGGKQINEMRTKSLVSSGLPSCQKRNWTSLGGDWKQAADAIFTEQARAGLRLAMASPEVDGEGRLASKAWEAL